MSKFCIWIRKKVWKKAHLQTVNSGYDWAEEGLSNEKEGFHILCMYFVFS